MLYKCIRANTSAIWQQAADAAYQTSSPSCSIKARHKILPFNEKGFQNFLEEGRRMDHEQQNDKTERARRLSRRTREEIVKGNQMRALWFQTGERTQGIPDLPSGMHANTYTNTRVCTNLPGPGISSNEVSKLSKDVATHFHHVLMAGWGL